MSLGDNPLSILRKLGFSQSQREQILASQRRLLDVVLTRDMVYLVSQSKQATILRLYDANSDWAFQIERQGSQLKTQKIKPRFQVKTERQSGLVRGSLMSSLQAKVPSPWVASRFMDAYSLEQNLNALPKGTKFDLTIEKLYDQGHFVKYGEVLKTNLIIAGESWEKTFYRIGQGGVFVGLEDVPSNRLLYAPVDYLRIASEFQPRRRHPITRRIQPHLGIDFELPEGSPIYAPRGGVVVKKGSNRAAGNYIVIRHSNGFETAYNHLERHESTLRVGQQVRTGEKIGSIGCTGYCTRPHLHFAVRKGGRMVDPAKYLKAYPHHFESSLKEEIASAQH